ncbi:single-stranded DNA-binding protein 2 isoform 2-T2 [Amazona ochrocephala]
MLTASYLVEEVVTSRDISVVHCHRFCVKEATVACHSDELTVGAAEGRLALYVYEYLLHVGAQKSAQTFLSEIRWEKNITLGEPPGFLHSWWCVFWDLYCAAPERRETCEHSSEAKAFHDYSAAAAPSPVLGNIPPGDGMPVGPVPPGFFQPFMSPRYPGGPRPPLRIPNQALGGVPGSQPLLPSGMDPTRQQGHPNMGGPMQRMTPPRGMVPLGPQNYGGAMRPPLNALGGPGMPGMNMGPGGGRPWPNPTNANSIPYSSASPGNYVGPPGGGGPPGTPIMPSPADSTNSGDNMYTLMSAVPPGPNRPNVNMTLVPYFFELCSLFFFFFNPNTMFPSHIINPKFIFLWMTLQLLPLTMYFLMFLKSCQYMQHKDWSIFFYIQKTLEALHVDFGFQWGQGQMDL